MIIGRGNDRPTPRIVLDFLDSNAAKQLSRLGVSMLLPALLGTNIGEQLEPL